MQEAGCEGGDIHFQVCEDFGDGNGVRDVGLGGGAALARVFFTSEFIGAAEEAQVGIRGILFDGGLDFVKGFVVSRYLSWRLSYQGGEQ